MADLFASADGNFTTASGWKVIDTTSLQKTGNTSVAVTTTAQISSTWTGSSATIEGVIVHLVSRSASPSGTFTCEIYNSTDSTITATQTINVSDITSGAVHYIYFKFGSSVTLNAAKAYGLRLKTSVTSMLNAYVSAGANWDRWLVTSTTATAAVADSFYILGDCTGAGTYNTRTMTMDINSTSNYGCMIIGQHGVVNFATTANTELRHNTLTSRTGSSFAVEITGNGILRQGSSSNRIGSSYTSTHRIEGTALNSMGVYLSGDTTIWERAGQYKTPFTTLAANMASSATAATLNTTPTNWLVGDDICFGASSRTTGQAQRNIISAISGTSLTLTTGLTVARDGASGVTTASGFSPGTYATQIQNLSRNCIFRGGTTLSTNSTFCGVGTGTVGGGGSINWLDCTATNVGNSTNSGAIYFTGNAALALTFNGVNMYDSVMTTSCASIFSSNTAHTGTISITNSNFCNNNAGALYLSATSSTTTPTITFNDNCYIAQVTTNATSVGVHCAAYGIEMQRNFFNDMRNNTIGVITFCIIPSANYANTGIFKDNVISNSAAYGLYISPRNTLTTGNEISGNVICRSLYGVGIFGGSNSKMSGFKVFGNTTENILLGASDYYGNFGVELVSWQVCGETSYASASGVNMSATAAATTMNGAYIMKFTNCDFGYVTGSATAHTTADFRYAVSDVMGGYVYNEIEMDYCRVASTVPFLNYARMGKGSYIACRDFSKVAGTHRTYYRDGLLTRDATIYKTVAGSPRMTPSSTTVKTEFSPMKVAVNSGNTVTCSLYIRKSVSGDGATYNGNQPRLILKANYAAGITADVVLATATNAANGAWELNSGTTAAVTSNCVLTFVVDCDGSVGWVNIDDVRFT